MSLIPNINNQSIAILSDIEQAKIDIANAINTKGGNSTPDESFQQLAEDIQTLPYAGISAEGIVQTEEFSFLGCYLGLDRQKITEIEDYNIEEITEIKSNRLQCFSNLQVCKFHALRICKISFLFNPRTITNLRTPIKVFYAPKCEVYTGASYYDAFDNSNTLEDITFGKLISLSGFFAETRAISLRNITIGQDTDINLPFQQWTATNVIAEGQSGIDELNSNLRTNLLEKLYDHSNDGQTRTLRIGWLANVSQANIDYATAKGWTLTT